MKLLILIPLILFIMATETTAQNTPPKPCTAPECSQFDFWLGEWELTYNDTVKATNRITREMEGHVVHEHFHDPANKYKGESWSVYSPQKKIWQQTWVDDQGGYIALTGTFADGKMVLTTQPFTVSGVTTQSRMVFYNITPNSFDWDWEATTDEGKTWKNNWRIHYKRKAG